MGKQKQQKPQAPAPAAAAAAGPGYLKPTGPASLTIAVHAKPGAKICAIALEDEVVNVSIDAPAREGEANAGIVEYMAAVLGVKRSAVSLAAGGKSREKVIAVEGITVAAAQTKLEAAATQ
jgi:hypothetical protein